jgi:hypothetical protein
MILSGTTPEINLEVKCTQRVEMVTNFTEKYSNAEKDPRAQGPKGSIFKW